MTGILLVIALLVPPPVVADVAAPDAAPSLALAPIARARQDTLAAARDLYTTAGYEDALAMLDRLRAANPAEADLRVLDQYRAFCLVALGRTVEAEAVIEQLTRLDPAWQLPDGEAPPRIAALFSTVRARAVPGVLRDRLAAARALYTDKQYAEAIEGFTALLELLKTPSVTGVAGTDITSLETIATGFRDLAMAADDQARAAQAKAAETQRASAAPAPAAPAGPTGSAPGTAGTAQPVPTDGASPSAMSPGTGAQPAGPIVPVTPPGIIAQAIPRPSDITLPMGAPATIVIDVLIDELGRVERVSVRQSVNRVYEAQLLNAARLWRYTPATQAGKPVKYLKTLEITLNPR